MAPRLSQAKWRPAFSQAEWRNSAAWTRGRTIAWAYSVATSQMAPRLSQAEWRNSAAWTRGRTIASSFWRPHRQVLAFKVPQTKSRWLSRLLSGGPVEGGVQHQTRAATRDERRIYDVLAARFAVSCCHARAYGLPSQFWAAVTRARCLKCRTVVLKWRTFQVGLAAMRSRLPTATAAATCASHGYFRR